MHGIISSPNSSKIFDPFGKLSDDVWENIYSFCGDANSARVSREANRIWNGHGKRGLSRALYECVDWLKKEKLIERFSVTQTAPSCLKKTCSDLYKKLCHQNASYLKPSPIDDSCVKNTSVPQLSDLWNFKVLVQNQKDKRLIYLFSQMIASQRQKGSEFLKALPEDLPISTKANAIRTWMENNKDVLEGDFVLPVEMKVFPTELTKLPHLTEIQVRSIAQAMCAHSDSIYLFVEQWANRLSICLLSSIGKEAARQERAELIQLLLRRAKSIIPWEKSLYNAAFRGDCDIVEAIMKEVPIHEEENVGSLTILNILTILHTAMTYNYLEMFCVILDSSLESLMDEELGMILRGGVELGRLEFVNAILEKSGDRISDNELETALDIATDKNPVRIIQRLQLALAERQN